MRVGGGDMPGMMTVAFDDSGGDDEKSLWLLYHVDNEIKKP